MHMNYILAKGSAVEEVLHKFYVFHKGKPRIYILFWNEEMIKDLTGRGFLLFSCFYIALGLWQQLGLWFTCEKVTKGLVIIIREIMGQQPCAELHSC